MKRTFLILLNGKISEWLNSELQESAEKYVEENYDESGQVQLLELKMTWGKIIDKPR